MKSSMIVVFICSGGQTCCCVRLKKLERSIWTDRQFHKRGYYHIWWHYACSWLLL